MRDDDPVTSAGLRGLAHSPLATAIREHASCGPSSGVTGAS